MVSATTLLHDTPTAPNLEGLPQKLLHLDAAMRDQVSNKMTTQKGKYKRYFDENVPTLLTFAIEDQFYVNRPPLTLVAETKNTLVRSTKLLPITMEAVTDINVKRHAITIDDDGIPNTISINRATPVSAKTQEATRITLNLDQPAWDTALENKYTECSGHPEYLVDKLVDHRHTSEDEEYKVRWYRYPAE